VISICTLKSAKENERNNRGGLKVGYCIFCRGETKNEPLEHIALEGLFGHQPFTSSTGII
jgi:hypothetical protein